MIGTLWKMHSAISLMVAAARAFATRRARLSASAGLTPRRGDSKERIRAAPDLQVAQGKEAQSPRTAEARTQPVRVFST